MHGGVTWHGKRWYLRTSERVVAVARKGYKTISKKFGIHQSTCRQIACKWNKLKTTITLPRSSWPTKITPWAMCVIVGEVTNPKVTSKQVKASVALANVKPNESTIRRRLNKCVHCRVARRKPAPQKEHSCLSAVCSRSSGKAWGILEECFKDRWNKNRTFWFKWRCYFWRESTWAVFSLSGSQWSTVRWGQAHSAGTVCPWGELKAELKSTNKVLAYVSWGVQMLQDGGGSVMAWACFAFWAMTFCIHWWNTEFHLKKFWKKGQDVSNQSESGSCSKIVIYELSLQVVLPMDKEE